MKNVLNVVIKVIMWIVILVAMSSLGFGTDNPRLMVPVYALFFAITFGLVLLFSIRKQKTKRSAEKKYVTVFKAILGAILIICGLIAPYVVFSSVGFTIGIYLMIGLLILVLLGISIFAIYMINKHKVVNSITGYLLLVAVSFAPALVMIQHDKSYHAIGLAYYTAVAVTVFFWFGISLLNANIRK